MSRRQLQQAQLNLLRTTRLQQWYKLIQRTTTHHEQILRNSRRPFHPCSTQHQASSKKRQRRPHSMQAHVQSTLRRDQHQPCQVRQLTLPVHTNALQRYIRPRHSHNISSTHAFRVQLSNERHRSKLSQINILHAPITQHRINIIINESNQLLQTQRHSAHYRARN